ncbi:cytochrome C biogenesis protein CcsA [Billgrantia diversa]|uniref:c-type cytochrome n=1 Tax=Halomonas sp. MCCC 1A13316 TaxID=2733487 RepID=UPI0018A4890F|nr:c-type cytochrome [Halomonas sp. MCCC 1A13316]QOR37809.1 cytochrome C biogenesis protein CcsA [Halomonas sp. MCCC 1A13316]
MKTIIALFSFGILLLSSLTVTADTHTDMQKLAEEKQCLSCHERKDDTPRAPGFNSIAAKYSDSEMRGYLIDVIVSGGEKHWGSAVMPEPGERAEVSEEEAEMLVDWILKMHPEKT